MTLMPVRMTIVMFFRTRLFLLGIFSIVVISLGRNTFDSYCVNSI